MKNVLVSPLDWGFGHATRCIPIIRELLLRGCRVFIAGSGPSLLLLRNELRNEFPSLTFFSITGYQPVYSSGKNMVWAIAKQVPKFVRTIRAEHNEVEELIERHKIDLVISDNRYGCWSRKALSIVITHQINILMPPTMAWLSRLVDVTNERLLKKFSVCWIPDFPDMENSLSGVLGHKKGQAPKIRYIGPLSRFSGKERTDHKYDLVCILSGPEPQRELLEKIIQEQVKNLSIRFLMIRGVMSSNGKASSEVDFLNSEALQTVISESSVIIARSGYSMIMDLATLGKKAIFIPTPGQTEQEYLADRWQKKGVAYSMPQQAIDIKNALIKCQHYTGFQKILSDGNTLLSDALNSVL
jgi:uncharacterized protein (TIGR00661 family)